MANIIIMDNARDDPVVGFSHCSILLPSALKINEVYTEAKDTIASQSQER